MAEPADPNAYLDAQIALQCNCSQKNEPTPSRVAADHADRCLFKRRFAQWVGWANVDTVAFPS